MTLRLVNVEGGVLEITALRSAEWVAATGCRAGEQVWLEFLDMAAKGWALIDAIEPCPALGKGPGRVVLTTFSQINDAVLRIWRDGATEVVEATERPPPWSEAHGEWRHAYEQAAGEKLGPMALGVRIGVPDLKQTDEPVAKSAILMILDTGLGERCAADIQYLEVTSLPAHPDSRGYMQLTTLPAYIEWRKRNAEPKL